MNRLLLIAMLAAGCAATKPLLQSALEAVGPAAVDALAAAAAERWGPDAQVDEPSAGCFPATEGIAESFGDDDGEYVYVTCRVRASSVTPQ